MANRGILVNDELIMEGKDSWRIGGKVPNWS